MADTRQPRATPNAENVQRLGQAILDLMAGQPSQDCDHALISVLAVSIGASHQMGGGTVGTAAVHLLALFEDARNTILRDWGTWQRGDH